MFDALETDLFTASRFRGLSTLYVGVVHDLRGPLNNMVVNLELLKQCLRPAVTGFALSTDSERHQQYIDVIQQEIYRLNRYVHTLLDMTAPTEEIRCQQNLTQSLTDIAGLIGAQAKLQRVELDWGMPDRPITVIGQPMHLRQALLNIIINALEAMPSGGMLKVRLQQDADVAVVEFRDTGSGIPESLRHRIFDMHFTTKAGRTGIGLYVARSVITELGGTIAVHSGLDAGTTVEVRLPVSSPDIRSADTEQNGASRFPIM